VPVKSGYLPFVGHALELAKAKKNKPYTLMHVLSGRLDNPSCPPPLSVFSIGLDVGLAVCDPALIEEVLVEKSALF
jgi:hypothetical protein